MPRDCFFTFFRLNYGQILALRWGTGIPKAAEVPSAAIQHHLRALHKYCWGDVWNETYGMASGCSQPAARLPTHSLPLLQCHRSKNSLSDCFLWMLPLIHQESSGKRSYREAAWGRIFRITRFTSVISSNLSVAIFWHADKVVYYKHSRLGTGGENAMASSFRNWKTRVALILSSLCST